jgi:hypothetical protein
MAWALVLVTVCGKLSAEGWESRFQVLREVKIDGPRRRGFIFHSLIGGFATVPDDFTSTLLILEIRCA